MPPSNGIERTAKGRINQQVMGRRSCLTRSADSGHSVRAVGLSVIGAGMYCVLAGFLLGYP